MTAVGLGFDRLLLAGFRLMTNGSRVRGRSLDKEEIAKLPSARGWMELLEIRHVHQQHASHT